MNRYQFNKIREDLEQKMVFLTGPRQSGKTWLSKQIAQTYEHSVYLNYDRSSDRAIMLEHAWLPKTDCLVLDECHKMPHWKNYLKGLYDTKPPHLRVLVTGSARLEVFNEVGDSMAGRYFLHRLLPFSPAELFQLNQPVDLERIVERGGFPEPYLVDNTIAADRWRLQYIDSLLRIDVLDFDKIQNLRAIQLVFELLRERVGSPLSYQSIAEEVHIAPNTVKKYLQILEALYIVFRVTPYSKHIARSLLKEPKIYFFDNGLVKGSEGARLENSVAVCLLKQAYAKTDSLGQRHALHYLRTKDQKEVDFALVNSEGIEKIIEVKLSDKNISPALRYFHEKYQLSAVQIVKNLQQERIKAGITLMKVDNFLKTLFL